MLPAVSSAALYMMNSQFHPNRREEGAVTEVFWREVGEGDSFVVATKWRHCWPKATLLRAAG